MIKDLYPSFWRKKGFLTLVLYPLSLIYQLLGFLRNYFAKSVKLTPYVICVGNITVGGTGKTQVVQWLANKLQDKKHNYLIVTNAYKARNRIAKLVTENDLAIDVGDESKMLSSSSKVVAAQSVQESISLIDDLKPEIVILDDRMQNPYLRKDLVILVFDASRAVGNNMIFPSGPLRESINSGIMKADIILVIGNHPCTDFNLINSIISSNKPFFKAQIKMNTKLSLDKNYIAFSAIGNPDKFFTMLKENGVSVIDKVVYQDHHHYSDQDIRDLTSLAKSKNATLVTTRKDYVKLNIKQSEIEVVDVELIFDNEEQLFSTIYEKAKTYI